MKKKTLENRQSFTRKLMQLLVLMAMLLAPKGAWATVATTGKLTNVAPYYYDGTASLFWKLTNDDYLDRFSVYPKEGGTASVSSDSTKLVIGGKGCTICELSGPNAPSDFVRIAYKVVISFDGNEDNSYISVKLGNVSFNATEQPGVFYLSKSVNWETSKELSIEIDKACTITGISLYTSIISNSASYDWTSSPVDNGTLNNAKNEDGSININAFEHQGYSYPFNVSGTVTYNSTNTDVATVATDGSITIFKSGLTTITASVHNENDYANDDLVFGYLLSVDFPAPTITPVGGYYQANTGITFSYDATNTPDFKYKWGDDGEVVSYGQTTPTMQTGTLHAWVEVTPQGRDAIKSDEATAKFTIIEGDYYGLTVAETPVTSANYGNVLGDGTVTFTPAADNEPATLTLSGATITGNIEVNNLSALKIKVVGANTITAGEVSAIKSNLSSGSCALTFSRGSNDVDCSLTLNSTGVTAISTGFSGPTYNAMALVAEGEQVDYRSLYGLSDYVNSEYKAVTSATITSYTTYGIIVAGQEVTNLNKNAIAKNQGANNSISYDEVNNVLTFNSIPNNSFNSSYPFIQTSMDLTINLVGTSEPDMGNVLIQRNANDNETHTLTFTTNESNPGMFIVRGGSFSHEGFNVVYNNHLAKNASGYYSGKSGDPADWVAIPKYGLTIAGVEVTEANADNVFGEELEEGEAPSVSFTPATGQTPDTLKLNNASIIPSDEQASGIVFTSNENFVIKIIGTNVVKGTGGNVAISGPTSVTDYSLTIERGDENDCSLRLESEGYAAISGFSSYGVADNQGLYSYSEETTNPQLFAEIFTTNILSGGSGTPNDPFIIKTAEDLKNMSAYLNHRVIDSNSSIKIDDSIEEIDCTDMDDFEMIGLGADSPFTGIFDGNNKTISNLHIDTEDYEVGLFAELRSSETESGTVSPTVKNLTLKGCSFSGDTYTGAIAGYMEGTSKIENCKVVNCQVTSNSYAGGIVGYCYAGTVEGNTVKGTTTVTSNQYSGAIAGKKGDGTFKNNKYYYTVTTQKNENESPVVKKDYEQRGLGEGIVVADKTCYDIIENDSVALYTKTMTTATVANATLASWYSSTNDYTSNSKFAPGVENDAYIKVTPTAGYAVSSVTVTYMEGETVKTITPVLDNDKTGDGDSIYVFTMPDADVDVTATLAFDISNRNYLPTTASATYTGSALEPQTVKLTPNKDIQGEELVLTNGTDFTITGYQFDGPTGLVDVDGQPINAGTYNVMIKGTGNYTGETTVFSYIINKANIPSGKYTVPTEKTGLMTYTGADQALVNAGSVDESLKDIVELKYYHKSITKDEYEGTSYSFPCEPGDGVYKANVPKEKNAGYYAIVYKFFGGDNYYDIPSTGLMKVAIDTADIANATIEEIADIAFTGEAIKPNPTVTFGQTPIELTANTDYTVAYTNNVNVGKATFTITGKGNFKGTQSTYFNIVNKTLNITFAENQTWASFYNTTEDFNLPNNVMAYIVTEIGQNSVTVAPINYVPKNVAVLLENNTTTTGVTNTSATGNLLYGVGANGFTAPDNATVYALYNNKMMRVASGTTIPAEKCYLVVGGVVNAGAPQLNIVFENEGNTTGINASLVNSEEVKGDLYDLQGRKVVYPKKKGLYIQKGRKVVVNNK